MVSLLSKVGPLAWNVGIATQQGMPTVEFMRKWQDLISATADIVIIGSKNIVAGTGLTGGGALGDPGDITLALSPTTLQRLVPAGGTTGQSLVKASNANYDTTWATVSGGGSGGALPLVNGDLPGPAIIADQFGQTIGVPIGTGISTTIVTYFGRGLFAARPATPAVAPGAAALYYSTDTAALSIWDGTAWH